MKGKGKREKREKKILLRQKKTPGIIPEGSVVQSWNDKCRIHNSGHCHHVTNLKVQFVMIRA